MRINSYGGDIKHGWAIANALLNTALDVHTYNDGLAASAAAIIYLGAKKENRHYGSLAAWMFHQIWTVAIGNIHDLRDEIAVLEKLNGTCASFINQNTAVPVDWMEIREDTWLNIDDMSGHGLVQMQEAYATEDPKDTLLKKEKMKNNQEFANRILTGYNQFQNSKQLDKQINEVMAEETNTTAPENVQLPADITEMKQSLQTITERLDKYDQTLTAKDEEIKTLAQSVKDKDAQIATLQQQIAGQPAGEAGDLKKDNVDAVSQQDDEYEDPFLQIAKSGSTISFS